MQYAKSRRDEPSVMNYYRCRWGGGGGVGAWGGHGGGMGGAWGLIRLNTARCCRIDLGLMRVVMGPNACQLSVKFEAICQ